MSRIDEALKRVSGDLPERGAVRVADATTRPADVATLEHFPRESSVTVAERAERVAPVTDVPAAPPAAPISQPPVRPVPAETAHQRPAAVRPNLSVRLTGELAGKLVVDKAASRLIVEQYRRIAAALHEAQVERGLKTLMVTSTAPREGKTLTALNLALTLSESYARRVLLIDADLRRPSMHEIVGIRNESGLSEALNGPRAVPAFVRITDRLWVLTAGHPGESPLASLTSERMRELLDDFEGEFDWVLLDTPPVGFLPDARLMAHLTRAVVFVIGAGSTPYPAVERAIADLGRECIVGTVLNRVEEKAIAATSYYYDAYGEAEPAPPAPDPPAEPPAHARFTLRRLATFARMILVLTAWIVLLAFMVE